MAGAEERLPGRTLTPALPPPPPARLCIVNDQLFVRKASNEEIRKAFVMPAPTPSSSPVPTLTAEQQEMLQSFSAQSGMNLEWSQKCLLDYDWNFALAAHAFTQLKVGAGPPAGTEGGGWRAPPRAAPVSPGGRLLLRALGLLPCDISSREVPAREIRVLPLAARLWCPVPSPLGNGCPLRSFTPFRVLLGGRDQLAYLRKQQQEPVSPGAVAPWSRIGEGIFGGLM